MVRRLLLAAALAASCGGGRGGAGRVEPADWKVKDSAAAEAIVASCDAVLKGGLTVEILRPASAAEPSWELGLVLGQGEGSTYLDRCQVDAASGEYRCSGETCP